MNELDELPRTGAWEVDLVDPPGVEIDGETLEAILLVAEVWSGLVRYGEPLVEGADITTSLVKAATSPVAPGVPARPTKLRCRKALAARLKPAATALGAKLKVTRQLPVLEEAITSLLTALSGGFPPDRRPWQPLMEALLGAAPWRHLPDGVEFRFDGGPPLLEHAVGLVLGLAGEQRGFVLYRNADDLAEFRELPSQGPLGVVDASF